MSAEDPFATLARRHADERPDARVLSFLDPQLEVVESLTYRERDDRARSVAAQVLERGLGGEPVVLSFPPGLDFVTAFCGCLYAGAVAVPATLQRSPQAEQRLAAILKDSSSRCMLTSAEHSAALDRHATGGAVHIDVLATDLLSPLADSGSVAAPVAEHMAFLHDWRLSGANTAPIDFGFESLSQTGVLERKRVDWLQQELSLPSLTWRMPLTELGIDSLKGMELVNVLSSAFDHTFPATSMLDHPTVASLAGLIRDTKLGIDTGRQGRSGDAFTAEQIDALDERELTEVLRRRIDDVLDGGPS
jgi:acyl carrier protein